MTARQRAWGESHAGGDIPGGPADRTAEGHGDQTRTVARAEGHGHEPANDLAVFLGGANENDDTHLTAGAEYTSDLSDRFALGVVGEHVDGVDAWVFVAPLSFRPVKGLGLGLYGGPGLTANVPEPGSEIHAEAEPHEGGREAFFLIRGGIG